MAGDTGGVDHMEEWQETLVEWTTGKNGRRHWWSGPQGRMAGDTGRVDHREEWQETLVGWTTGKNGRRHW